MNTDEEEPKRPKVVVDGQEVVNKPTTKISKRTLDVYKFLISNPGFHGVRDLQKYLNYSSPGSVSYHLKRLMKYNLIIRTEDGKYGIYSETGSTDDLARYIGLMLDTIPRYTYFALLLIFTGVFVFISGFFTHASLIIVIIGSLIPTIVGGLLFRQSLEFADYLEEINQLVLDMED